MADNICNEQYISDLSSDDMESSDDDPILEAIYREIDMMPLISTRLKNPEGGIVIQHQQRLVENAKDRPRNNVAKVPKKEGDLIPEFLRDLLLDPEYCNNYIRWEDYSNGKFRFLRPHDIAILWSQKSQKRRERKYQNFMMAIRRHYRTGKLFPVTNAPNVFKFGINAPDYQTENPNFELANVE